MSAEKFIVDMQPAIKGEVSKSQNFEHWKAIGSKGPIFKFLKLSRRRNILAISKESKEAVDSEAPHHWTSFR